MKNKRNTLTNLLKFGVLLFGVSLFLWNCQKDDNLSLALTNTEKTIIQKELISINQIPKLQKFIANKNIYNTKILSHKGLKSSPIGIIDTSKIIKIVDSLSQITYTLRILKLNNESNESPYFDNLVLKQINDDYKPYILRYHLYSTSDYLNNYNNIREIQYIEVNKNELGFNLNELVKKELCRTTVVKDCGLSGHHESLDAPGCNSDTLYVTVSVVCSGGSDPYSGGGGTYNPGSEPDSPEQGSGSGGTSTPITMLESEDIYRINALDQQLNLNIKERSFLEKNTLLTKNTFDFCYLNQWSNQANTFAKLAIKNESIKYINENFEFTKKSPFNVDMTQVLDSIKLPPTDSTKIANEKFLCLYNKLAETNTYKNLFTNIFGGTQNLLNVEFKVTKDLKDDDEPLNGLTTGSILTNNANGNVVSADMLIEINEELLTSNSSFNALKTILHESIHAYLKLKQVNCTGFSSFGQHNNKDICETINTYYNNFSCNGNQSQHEFMFDYMLPTFKTIYNEIGKTSFMTQGNIDGLSDNYNLQYLNNPNDPNGINIASQHMFNWDEFYLYNTLPGLHNTDAFKNEIENNVSKKELYRAYKELAKRHLKNNCND